MKMLQRWILVKAAKKANELGFENAEFFGGKQEM